MGFVLLSYTPIAGEIALDEPRRSQPSCGVSIGATGLGYSWLVTNKDPRRTAYLPFAALALLALVWGYNWVVMKVGVRYADPFVFAALRHFLGAIALFVVVALRGGPLRPKAFWWTVLFGLFQTSMAGLTIWAVQLGGAGKTSVLTYTMPFWVLLIAWPVLSERIRGSQWVAVVMALAGLVFVLDPWELQGVQASILAVAGGLAWAIGSVLYKIIRKRHDVDLLSLTAWQALLGSIPLIVVAVLIAPEGPVWNGSFIAALAYNVFAASALAWVLWLYVLHHLSAGTAGISSLAIPVVGVLSAWVQLGERPGAFEATGMALILAALAILTLRGLRTGRQGRVPAPPDERTSTGSTPVIAGGRRSGSDGVFQCHTELGLPHPDGAASASGVTAPGLEENGRAYGQSGVHT